MTTDTALTPILQLSQGSLRIAQKINGAWQVNSDAKNAVLDYFRTHDNISIDANMTHYYDKVPLKYAHYNDEDFKRDAVRVVPGAIVREGAFIGKHCVIMPSFINIGAYIDERTMIDTWASVGSCAQIGKNVHLSGGAGIGGVLEPIQATPTIIEDNCFIGARSEIVEGVIVEEGAVISMGVFIGQSTPIYDRTKDEVTYGHVPPYSVVVPGSLPGKNGCYHLNAAIIVKQVTQQTREKVSINAMLRDID